jgi:hypothetical protein
MIPFLMHFQIKKPGGRLFGFYFPVILVWIILAAFLLILFPFVLFAALITWTKGPGRALLLFYPMLGASLWNLSGTHIETKRAENQFLIAFR